MLRTLLVIVFIHWVAYGLSSPLKHSRHLHFVTFLATIGLTYIAMPDLVLSLFGGDRSARALFLGWFLF